MTGSARIRAPRSTVAPTSRLRYVPPMFHGTTVLCVRRPGGSVVMAGDGQVTLDKTVMKSTARKLRRLGEGQVLAGFAGATADAFQLFELFEKKLKEHARSLPRASVELAKQWRTDRLLHRLEALLFAVLRRREEEDLGVEDFQRSLELLLGAHLHRAVEARRERVLVPALRRVVVLVFVGERDGHRVRDLRGAIDRRVRAPEDR